VADRARLVIIERGSVAAIERRRDGRHYFVFPGGGIEAGEMPEEAAIREAWEELGLRVAIRRLLARVTQAEQLLHIFLADAIAGDFGTGAGLEMIGGRPDRGSYTARWLPVDQLPNLPIYPRSVAQLVVAAATSGWPDRAIELTESAPREP
jgi:8-oxo-dGTP pyrophosphatase MutT (NUDIX family)